MEDKKQKAVCMEHFRRRDEDERNSLSDIDVEREEECAICLEMNSKVVLPNCTHAMCLRCYQDWYAWNFSFCPHFLCYYSAYYFHNFPITAVRLIPTYLLLHYGY
jgi:hypothetical protein